MNENIKEKLKKGVAYSAILLSVATIGIVGGNTYSKYFTKIDGEGNAEISRWSFRANNTSTVMEKIQLNNVYNTNILKNKTDDSRTKTLTIYPILKIKDIIIIKKSNTYNVNDIITYNTENEVLITHRIVKSCEGGFITKGDNNNSEDNELVKLENIKGKVILRINRNYQILIVLLFIVLVFFVSF